MRITSGLAKGAFAPWPTGINLAKKTISGAVLVISCEASVQLLWFPSIHGHQIRFLLVVGNRSPSNSKQRNLVRDEISHQKINWISKILRDHWDQHWKNWLPHLGQNVDQVEAQLPMSLAIANVHIRSASEHIGLGLGKTCGQNQLFRSPNSKSEVC